MATPARSSASAWSGRRTPTVAAPRKPSRSIQAAVRVTRQTPKRLTIRGTSSCALRARSGSAPTRPMTRWLVENVSTRPVRIAPPDSTRKADVSAASEAAEPVSVCAKRRSRTEGKPVKVSQERRRTAAAFYTSDRHPESHRERASLLCQLLQHPAHVLRPRAGVHHGHTQHTPPLENRGCDPALARPVVSIADRGVDGVEPLGRRSRTEIPQVPEA